MSNESDYIFFWDHIVTPTNPYSLAVFSQWYPLAFTEHEPDPSLLDPRPRTHPHTLPDIKPSPTTMTTTSLSTSSSQVRDRIFKTAEHYMMYRKALLFDPSRAQDVIDASTPSEAQKIGRELTGFDRKIWDKYNDGIVERANYLKFGQDSDGLALNTVLNTGKGDKVMVMVEASPKDRIWGIGYGREDAWEHREDWGTNR